MGNKTINKKILVLISTLLIIFSITNIKVYALGDPVEDPDFYKPPLTTNSISTSDIELKERVGSVLGIINVIGVVVSVITLMIIGVKYMLGSVEEKAEYKKTAIYYILGAVLIFSVTTIPNALYAIGISLSQSV